MKPPMHDTEDHAERRHRTLTDEDVEALAELLERRLMERMYGNIGRGVWALAKRGALLLLLALASYGVITKAGSQP